MELFAQEMMNVSWGGLSWSDLLDPRVLVFVIPISAIVIFGIKGIMCSCHRHRERIEMIRSGIHPDHPDASPDVTDIGETTSYES